LHKELKNSPHSRATLPTSTFPESWQGKQNRGGEKYMSVSEYAQQVVDNFITDITDHVFLSIERDDNSMREYKSNVNSYGLEAVNTAIGKKVKELLDIENDGESNEPKSQLIRSYTRHKRK